MKKTNEINKRSRVCLIDLRLSGHHGLYLAHFTKSFLDQGLLVDVLTPDPVKCKALVSSILPNLNLDSVLFLQTNAKIRKYRKHGCFSYDNLKTIDRELDSFEREHKKIYSFLFFAYLDDFSYVDFALPYFLRVPLKRKFSGLLMAARERYVEDRHAFPLNLLSTTFLEQRGANYKKIGLLVEDVQKAVEQRIGRQTVVYPDFCSNEIDDASEHNIIKEIRHRAGARTIVSLVGSIQPHKSVDLFLNCIKEAAASNYYFVLVGDFYEPAFEASVLHEVKSALSSPPENLFAHTEWIESEAIFDSIIKNSNLLFGYYRNFTKSSNVLTKSAFYGRPIIVSDQHLMGQRVKKYRLGFALPEKEVVEGFRSDAFNGFSYDHTLRGEFLRRNSLERLDCIIGRTVDELA